jgi:hypothetical protein
VPVMLETLKEKLGCWEGRRKRMSLELLRISSAGGLAEDACSSSMPSTRVNAMSGPTRAVREERSGSGLVWPIQVVAIVARPRTSPLLELFWRQLFCT